MHGLSVGSSCWKRGYFLMFVHARQLPRTNAEVSEGFYAFPRRLRVNYNQTIFDRSFHKAADSFTSDKLGFLRLLMRRDRSRLP